MPCAIVLDDSRYIISVEYTTVKHMKKLEEISKQWVMCEEYARTILADTDGGCDRTEYDTRYHKFEMENAIFDGDEIIGFYFDIKLWNGSDDKPNAHIFLIDDSDTWKFYTYPNTWILKKR